ncbi:MAG: hypothetical protein Q8K63_01620 [Acidimicrobiales bacterium]|nr:hypothetical protein [Acidimicrobiales bacterium]
MSIGTLGLVNFRSKKEKLARAEAALGAEHIARTVAESSISKVEAELRRLTGAEQKAAKQLAKLRRSRKVRKAETLSTLLAGATPTVKDGMQTARSTVSDMTTKGRKHGRKARKAARSAAVKASHDIRVGAEKVLCEARAVLAES